MSMERTLPQNSRKAVLLFHGGPGLHYNYLEKHLAVWAESRRLIFVNRGDERSLSTEPIQITKFLASLNQELVSLLKKEPFDIFAHSWGCLVALQWLQKCQPGQLHRIVLVNPVPLDWSSLLSSIDYQAALIPRRLTASELKRVQDLDARQDAEASAERLRLFLPLYVHDRAKAAQLDFGDFDSLAYSQFTEAATNYSLESIVTELHQRIFVVGGEEDFIRPDFVNRYFELGCEGLLLPKVAHSPFLEDPEKFFSAVDNFLEDQGAPANEGGSK